ncbi:MAG: ATP-binding protein [Clostridia bacterium]|nr:ATP-binding protein [Clostridia bacterium]
MIHKLVRQMLLAQALSALTVSVCLLVDNIMIGRFLGEDAIAAYGYANPVLLVLGALGSMLAAGVQVSCSRSLGMGSQEETNRGYSSAVAVTLSASAVLMLVVLIFRNPLSTLLGAGTQGSLYDGTRSYLAGFIISAPAAIGALMLVAFLQMAGKTNLVIASVLSMTVADIALDLVNVYLLHWNMFGMGLASALSYYIALCVGGTYFLSKKCVFRFSLKYVSWKKVLELFQNGIPSLVSMASTVILIFTMNQILSHVSGSVAVAAFTVLTTIGNASNCISTGTGGVSLTLSGIFFQEEDRSSLGEVARTLFRSSIIIGLGMGAILLVFAPALVSLFLPEVNEAQRLAILGVRIFSAGLIPCCLNNALKSHYQACGRLALTEIISLLEGAIIPSLAALALSAVFGVTGAWLYFVTGELLMFIGICAYALHRPANGNDNILERLLLLSDDFGFRPDETIELDIHSIDDVMAASRKAEDFCARRNGSDRLSKQIALCVEEMGSNVVTHGFDRSGRQHLSMRLLQKAENWVLRFRDDCRAFDPVNYVPQSEEQGIGIKLVMAMASEVRYTYSLSLNNLTILIRERENESAT